MWLFISVFLLAYIYHAIGITLGYHRLLSHRSYKVPKLLEYFIVMGGYLCCEGSPIFWVSTHRLHHRYSDKPGDPHRPMDGRWHAFLGWMYKPRVLISKEQSQSLAPDLYRDPFYRFLHFGHTQLDGPACLLISILYRAALYALFGPLVFWAELSASICAFMAPLIVNLFCHMPKLGYAPFECGDQSRNVWLVAMLSLGEGWHNNHHAHPKSAQFGIFKGEFDLTWQVIRLFSFLGLAKDIRLARLTEPKSEDAVTLLDSSELSRNVRLHAKKDESSVSRSSVNAAEKV
ncbi:MAG: fatty acid desaturase [Candidatus Obscuribacterales bacterium]|nr:fatty acid desaturase [Candidatus Obscuribacterales bacterium]